MGFFYKPLLVKNLRNLLRIGLDNGHSLQDQAHVLWGQLLCGTTLAIRLDTISAPCHLFKLDQIATVSAALEIVIAACRVSILVDASPLSPIHEQEGLCFVNVLYTVPKLKSLSSKGQADFSSSLA